MHSSKKYMLVIFLIVVMVFSCAVKQNDESNIGDGGLVVATDVLDHRYVLLQKFLDRPMVELVKHLSQYDIPMSIYEKEDNYYLGFIRIDKDLNFITGYEGDGFIDLEISSISYMSNEMVIKLNRANIYYDEKTKERRLYFIGLIQVVLTKQELYSAFENYFLGSSRSRALHLIGEVLEQPEL